MLDSETLIGLPDFQITGFDRRGRQVVISAEYTGTVACPECGSADLRMKDTYRRKVRHESWGRRHCVLLLKAHKWLCRACEKYFRQQFPGLLKWQHATEAFRQQIFQDHWDGINRSRLGKREEIGAATVERHFQHFLQRRASERDGGECPRVLGIDEHFFSRRHGFATTLCDLARHKVFDVVRGRSQAALDGYLSRLKGRERVRVVCIDLSSTYRSIVRQYFPNALIVADRFHVIRLIGQQFLNVWRMLDPAGSKNRGLLSLMRRHGDHLSPEQKRRLAQYFEQNPAAKILYEQREEIWRLLLLQHRTARACRRLAPVLLGHIGQLRACGFAPLQSLGETMDSWKNEIARMWRFTRNNGITEGFHTKMEVLQRQAYGFRNFNNYRMRVVVMCS